MKAGIEARVETREKHLYSIYQKMRASARRSPRSSTCTACASSSTRVDTCYRALGVVHSVLQADAGALQGLHRDPARQRLPVAAHDAVRPERRADRGADPHRATCTAWPSPASPRTGSTRTGDDDGSAQQERAREWLSNLVRDAGGRQLRGVPRERQGRPVPGQGLRVHAARARSCACRAAPPWSTSPTRCTPTSATAASPPRSTGA